MPPLQALINHVSQDIARHMLLCAQVYAESDDETFHDANDELMYAEDFNLAPGDRTGDSSSRHDSLAGDETDSSSRCSNRGGKQVSDHVINSERAIGCCLTTHWHFCFDSIKTALIKAVLIAIVRLIHSDKKRRTSSVRREPKLL